MPTDVDILEDALSKTGRQGVGDVQCPTRQEPGAAEWRVAEVVREWMESYLASAHPSMPRPGAVCPFVRPALETGEIEVRSEPAPERHPERVIVEVTRRALTEFAESPLPGRHRAVLLVFPDLLGRGDVIDDVHAVVKIEAVRAGLMLGQFHAGCAEPSARNGGFAVNRSPVPLFAIRHMTVHDILFLHGDRDCFWEYVQRFGHLYRKDRRIDPAFRELYDGAITRFGADGGRDVESSRDRRPRCPVTGETP